MLRHDTAHKESLDEVTSRLEFGAQPPGTGSSASGQDYFCTFAPASSAIAASVVCAAFKPRRKSASEYVV